MSNLEPRGRESTRGRALTQSGGSASLLRGTGLKIDNEGNISDKNWFQWLCDPLQACRIEHWGAKEDAILETGDIAEELKTKIKKKGDFCFRKYLFQVIHWFPIVNYFYFAFYQKSPGSFAMMVTVDSLGEVGLLVGTVAALFYTVMTAMPTSVSWDEFDTVDRHWESTTQASWATFTAGVAGCEDVMLQSYDNKKCWNALTENADGVTKYTDGTVEIGKYGCVIDGGGHMPWRPVSVRIGNQMSDSANWLLFSVILSVIFVISVQSLARVRQEIKSPDMDVPEDSIEAWFFFGRWVILGSLLMLVWGAYQAVSVIGDVMYVKFPHPWLEQICREHGWERVEDVTFDTLVEIPAAKYSGGRFVSYITASDTHRWSKELITRGNITTNIRDLDPMRKNGRSYWLMGVFTIGAMLLCGYGAACADTQAKIEQRKKLGEEIDAPVDAARAVYVVSDPQATTSPKRKLSENARKFQAAQETEFGSKTTVTNEEFGGFNGN